MSAEKLFVRTCEICKQTFATPKRYDQYCSAECARKKREHICLICKKPFTSTRKKAAYCSLACFRKGQSDKADERGKEIVRLHEEEGFTFQQLAEEFAVSRPRAHQLYVDQKKRAG